jgi:hypothetical protein
VQLINLTQYNGCTDNDLVLSDFFLKALNSQTNNIEECFVSRYNCDFQENGAYFLPSSAQNCTLHNLLELNITNNNPPTPIVPVVVETLPQNRVCYDGGIVLSTQDSYPNYYWSTGSTSSTITVAPGTYTFTTSDAFGCSYNTTYTTSVNSNSYNLSLVDYPNGLIISSPSQSLSAGSDNIIRVIGDITINPNINYSVANKVFEFLDNSTSNSGVIIQENAKLTSTNCTYTSPSTCPTKMWEGFKICGPTTSQPGILNLNSSRINDARIGVKTIQDNATTLKTGILNALSSRFQNNHKAIVFDASSQLYDNPSSIRNCSFVCNALLKDNIAYPNQGTNTFITLNHTKNVKIQSNTFQGFTNLAVTNRGTAIKSFNSSYLVSAYIPPQYYSDAFSTQPNTFLNLTKGLLIESTGGALQNIRISLNKFTNVLQGITATGANFSEISSNEFFIPDGINTTNKAFGLYLISCNGYLLSENTFHSLNNVQNEYRHAVVTKYSTLSLGEMHRNNFTGVFKNANQFEFDNSNLKIDCNKYTGQSTHDWEFLIGATLNGQGQCNSSTILPRANEFNPFSNSTNVNIKGTSGTTLFYRAYAGMAPLHSAGLDVDDCSGQAVSSLSCPVKVRTRIVGNGNANVNAFMVTPPGQDKDILKGDLIREFAQAGNPQALVAILTSTNAASDIEVLIPTHLDKGECPQARALLANMERDNFDKENAFRFFDILTRVCESDRINDELTLDEKAVVEEISLSDSRLAVQA